MSNHLEMAHDSATVEAGASTLYEGDLPSQQISFDTLLEAAYQSVDKAADNAAFDYFSDGLDLSLPHNITLTGPLTEDYIATYDPKRNLDHDEDLKQERSLLEAQVAAIEPLVTGQGARGRNTFENKRKLDHAKKELVRIGMTVIRMPKIEFPQFPAYNPDAISGPVFDRVKASGTTGTRNDVGKMSHAATALAAVPLVASPIMNEQTVATAKSLVIAQPTSEQFQILASVVISDLSQLKTDEDTGALYQIVEANGQSVRVDLDKAQLIYVESLRKALASQKPADASGKKYTANLPIVGASIVREKIVKPVAIIPNTSVPPTNTPVPPETPVEPTPTSKATATEIAKVQGDLDIKSDAEITLDNADIPRWSLGYIVDTDGEVTGKPIGSILGDNGKISQIVVDIGDKRGKVNIGDLVDQSQIVDIKPAKSEDMLSQKRELVSPEHPLVVTQNMALPFIGGTIKVLDNRRDQSISMPFNINSGTNTSEITEPVFGSFYIFCDKTTLSISPRNDGHSLVVITTTQPDNTGKNVFVGDIGDIDDRKMRLNIANSRNAFEIIDESTGLPITISEIKNSSEPSLNQPDLEHEDDQSSGTNWIRFPEGELAGSDMIEVGYIGYTGVIQEPGSFTINSLALEIAIDPINGQNEQVVSPELEQDNGFAAYSDRVSMPVDYALNPFASPNIEILVNENGSVIDASQGEYTSVSAFGDSSKPLSIQPLQEALITWGEKIGQPIKFGFNAAEVPPGFETRQHLKEYVNILAELNNGQAVPITDFYNPKTGAPRTDLPWATALYNGNAVNFLADVIRMFEEANVPVELPAPKADKAAHQNMFGKNQTLKKEGSITQINIDVGGLQAEDALQLMLQYKDMGLRVNMVGVASNIGGLSGSQLVDLSILTGASLTIGSPSEGDPSKKFAVTSQQNSRVVENQYTDVYTEIRDRLSQVQADSGKHLVVFGAINDNPHYYAKLRETQTLWNEFKEVHAIYKIDVDKILDAALERAPIQS